MNKLLVTTLSALLLSAANNAFQSAKGTFLPPEQEEPKPALGLSTDQELRSEAEKNMADYLKARMRFEQQDEERALLASVPEPSDDRNVRIALQDEEVRSALQDVVRKKLYSTRNDVAEEAGTRPYTPASQTASVDVNGDGTGTRPYTSVRPKTAAGKPMAKASPISSGPGAKLLIDGKQYEDTLYDLAAKAQKIVDEMPSDPANVARNFGDLGDVLRKSKKHLMVILDTRNSLDAQAGKILDSAAGYQQQFIDLGKKVDQQIKDTRAKQNSDHPVSITTAVSMLEGTKKACKSGEQAMLPLRDHVQAAQLMASAVFEEIGVYPPIFDLTIEACDLYKNGIGDATLYLGMVQDLVKARESLRTIVLQFQKAADKAEKMIREIPNQNLQGVPLQ